MKPLEHCRLYSFIDTGYLRSRDPAALAAQLCEGGSDLIQLRAKGSPPEVVSEMATRILPITRAWDVGLVINDHVAVAAEVGAEICHLGQEDFFDAGWTRTSELRPMGSSLQFGLSTHAPDQAERAIAAGADYVAIGPVFPTGTKPGVPSVTLEYVRWASAHIKIPWFAIGGIHPGNLDSVIEAGASRVCVVSAILNAPDVAGMCREIRKRLPA